MGSQSARPRWVVGMRFRSRTRVVGVLSLAALSVCLPVLASSAKAAPGTWDRAWGRNVNGGGVFGICTVAASCLAGVSQGGSGEMFEPVGVATDSGGNVYVADTGNSRIEKFNSSGTFDRTWGVGVNATVYGNVCTAASEDTCQMGIASALDGEMNFPDGIATDSGGMVYVADTLNNRIDKFGPAGQFDRAFGKSVNLAGGDICTAGSGIACQAGASTTGLGGELNGPVGVAVDSGGNIYVGDTGNNRIDKFDPSGAFERTWGKDVNATTGGNLCTAASGNTCQAGSATTAEGGAMRSPAGVAVDSGGNVYVADAFNQRIQVFNSSGTFERAWGVHVNGGGKYGICTVAASCKVGFNGGLGGEMYFPVGVAVSSGGEVYVADYQNSRIQKFTSSGHWDRAWGKGVNGGAAFGTCTVAASCLAGTAGGLGGEMAAPNGIAVDSGGTIYLADTENSRIQKFHGPPDAMITKATVSSKRRSATFKIRAVGQADGLRCELKRPRRKGHPKSKAKFSRCSSPKAYGHLRSGHYSFLVSAFNKAGSDALPGRKSFKIK